MIKIFLLLSIVSCSFLNAETTLENGNYTLTNKNKIFEFNGIRDKYFEFKIKENFIYNKYFDSYYILEENGEFKLHKYYDKDTLVKSNKEEKWIIKNNNYDKSYFNNKNCSLLTNEKYELLLCKEKN